MKNIFRHTCLLLIIITLYTGSVNNESMINGIISAKSAWFILVTGILLIITSADILTLSAGFKLNNLDILVLLFLSYTILNGALHDRMLFSLKNIESLGLLIFYFISKYIYSWREFPSKIYIISLLFLAFIQIGSATLQWNDLLPSYNSNFRFTGFFLNPSPFAIFLSLLLVYCLAFFLYDQDKIIKTASLIFLIAGISIVLITVSRSAWLGLITATLFMIETKFQIVHAFISYLKSIKAKTLTLALILISVTLISFFLYNIKKDSADGRLLIWKLSFSIIKDHIFTGIGQGNFGASLLKYQAAYFNKYPENIFTEGRLVGNSWYAFNDLLQITAEHGIIGLILFIILLFFTIRSAVILLKSLKKFEWARKEPVVVGSVASLIIILISGLFSYPLVILPLQIMFYTAIAFTSANNDNLYIKTTTINAFLPQKIKIWSMAGVCCICGIYFISYAKNIYQAYTAWYIQSMENQSTNIKELTKFHFLNEDPQFILMKGEYFLSNNEYDKAINILEGAKQSCPDINLYYILGDAYTNKKKYKKAEEQYTFLSYAIPHLLRPKYLLAELYYETGQAKKWNQQALEVINFKPKVSSLSTDNMMNNIKIKYYMQNN